MRVVAQHFCQVRNDAAVTQNEPGSEVKSAAVEQGQKKRNTGVISNVKDRIIQRKCQLLSVSLTYLKLILNH